MAILDEFDPQTNGWFFENWGETSPFSWDLFRRTYLGVNPTQDIVAAPLDVAFYEIFKTCAELGNCGGCSMLALALYKYGGFMGFCSPAAFYTGGGSGPDRPDLHQAINIMQARQFSAFGIQNFLDVVKAGELNHGLAAFERVKSGLASGDYCMLSLSNGLFGDAAHTVVPYKIDESTPGTKIMFIWDPIRPFDTFPDYYTSGLNRIIITGPTSWTYDQTAGGSFTDGTTYSGSMGGWCFAIPFSLELHKGRHPFSVGFLLTNLTLLFISGTGSAVTQISDGEGRRFYTSDRPHGRLDDIETTSSRRLEGVARWPWYGAPADAPLPGDLYIVQRPPTLGVGPRCRLPRRPGTGRPPRGDRGRGAGVGQGPHPGRRLHRRDPGRSGRDRRGRPARPRPPASRRTPGGRLAERRGPRRARRPGRAARRDARRARRRRGPERFEAAACRPRVPTVSRGGARGTRHALRDPGRRGGTNPATRLGCDRRHTARARARGGPIEGPAGRPTA
jgi:hypothetical protein